MYFFLFSPFQIHYILYIGLVISLTYIVLIFGLYMLMHVLSPISLCVVSFSFFIHMFLILCMQSIISVSH